MLLDTDIYEPLLLRNFDAARIVADDELVPLRNAWVPAQNWSLEGSFSAVKLDEFGILSASAHREPGWVEDAAKLRPVVGVKGKPLLVAPAMNTVFGAAPRNRRTVQQRCIVPQES